MAKNDKCAVAHGTTELRNNCGSRLMINGSWYKNPRNHGITNQRNYFNENEKTSYGNVNGNENRLEVSG